MPTGEDAYEQNDIPSQADLITAASGALSTTNGFATATDTDWYRFNAAAGTFTATLDSVASEGELNIENSTTSTATSSTETTTAKTAAPSAPNWPPRKKSACSSTAAADSKATPTTSAGPDRA